jgi:hypothetical protein
MMPAGMRRWAPNLAAGASAAVMLLALGMAVRSVFVVDLWERRSVTPGIGWRMTTFSILSGEGNAGCAVWTSYYDSLPPLGSAVVWDYRSGSLKAPRKTVFGRFDLNNSLRPPGGPDSKRGIGLTVPWWFIALLASVLPAWWGWRWRKQRKLARGRGFEVVAAEGRSLVE